MHCNIPSFYHQFVDAMRLIVFDHNYRPMKPPEEVITVCEIAIQKFDKVDNMRGDRFMMSSDKAALEFHRKNYDACIELLDEFHAGIQMEFGREHIGIQQSFILRFEYYLEKSDYKNAKYCLSKAIK